MQAIADYQPQNQGELGFRAGDYIEVVQPGEPGGWWLGKNNGQEGWFPTPYAQQV